MGIFKRLPKWPEIAALYAVIVLVIYGWTLLWFFWKFPSWLYFLSVGEILKVLVYAITTNFFESLVVLMVLVIINLGLPLRWFPENNFVARSMAMSLVGLGYMMFLAGQFQGKEDYPALALLFAPLVLVAVFLAGYFTGKIELVRRVLAGFADRAIVFLYISIPISLLCLLIVLAQLAF